MNKLDVINSIFQVGAGFALFGNVHRSYKEKRVLGVSIFTQLYIVIWGLFALYFFFTLNQLFSMWTSFFVLLINSTWLFQIFYYREKKVNG